MPPPVGITRASYTPVSSSGNTRTGRTTVTENLIQLGNPEDTTLEGLLTAFKSASGDADAPLRGNLDGSQILVPRSPGLLSGGWTRFKSALSGLPLFNRLPTLRAARAAEKSLPLHEHQDAESELRHQVQSVIRKEVGTEAGDIEFGLPSAVPLTKRTVERVLSSAVERARQRAPQPQHPVLPAIEPEAPPSRRERPYVFGQSPAPRNTIPNGPSLRSALERALQSHLPGRHEGLLVYCAELARQEAGGAHVGRTAEAARQLHDKVQAYLVRAGRWPIEDAADFDEEVKPLAAALAVSG